MKKLIFFFAILAFSCKAQTPIIPLNQYQSSIGKPAYSYFKDTNNDMDKFVGTWKYVENGKEFTITFQKRLMVLNTILDNMYEDLLIGEYIYKENNVEIINTISNLNTTDPVNESNVISVSFMTNGTYPQCNCSSNDFRIKFIFYQPEREYISSRLVAKHYQELGEDFLEIFIYNEVFVAPNENSPGELSVPTYKYMTFIKQ